MENLVNVYFFGKKYQVPESLTIMKAMEYAGYQLVRGCGCRNGFCGACATIYRIKGDRELKACLACQTKVEDNMYIATLPFFPLVKQVYDIETVPVNETVMMQLYPEIYSCIGCNACTKSCTQELNVMQYIAYAQRGDFEKCAEEFRYMKVEKGEITEKNADGNLTVSGKFVCLENIGKEIPMDIRPSRNISSTQIEKYCFLPKH